MEQGAAKWLYWTKPALFVRAGALHSDTLILSESIYWNKNTSPKHKQQKLTSWSNQALITGSAGP